MDHESRDLDGVIDEIAQAMTRAELPRDLRPAIAGRLAARHPSWQSVWRLAAASAAVVLVAVVVVSRPGGKPQQTRPITGSVARPEVAAGGAPGPAPARLDVARVTEVEARPARPFARVARQTIAPSVQDFVTIDPVAIVPLEKDDVTPRGQAPSQVVVIAPIDVEPVRISQIELVE